MRTKREISFARNDVQVFNHASHHLHVVARREKQRARYLTAIRHSPNARKLHEQSAESAAADVVKRFGNVLILLKLTAQTTDLMKKRVDVVPRDERAQRPRVVDVRIGRNKRLELAQKRVDRNDHGSVFERKATQLDGLLLRSVASPAVTLKVRWSELRNRVVRKRHGAVYTRVGPCVTRARAKVSQRETW